MEADKHLFVEVRKGGLSPQLLATVQFVAQIEEALLYSLFQANHRVAASDRHESQDPAWEDQPTEVLCLRLPLIWAMSRV